MEWLNNNGEDEMVGSMRATWENVLKRVNVAETNEREDVNRIIKNTSKMIHTCLMAHKIEENLSILLRKATA